MSYINRPFIETISDRQEFAGALLKCVNDCVYFTENLLDITDIHEYNKPFLNCTERFIVFRCIEENEFIYCENGIKQCKNIKHGDNILGGTVNNVHSFEDELLHIKFINGAKIKVNKEHPFYTKNGWKEARYLTTGDEIEFRSAQNFRTGVKSLLNNDIIKLMGYLHSDGSICNGREVRFVNTNKDLIDDVIEISTRAFPININHRVEYHDNGNKPSHRLRFTSKVITTKKNSNPLMKFIRENNMMQKDTFGDVLLALPRDELKQFVSGYFNGDGSLTISNGENRNSVHVKFCIGNKRQRAYEFQYMLWKLGLDSLIISLFNSDFTPVLKFCADLNSISSPVVRYLASFQPFFV